MNPVEIEQAISDLAEAPFDAAEFPYAFLEAFGRKETEIKKLRKGDSNKSDLGGVLQRNNIHIATCAPGEVSQTLAALKASPTTAKHKAKFVLATDGQTFEAEDLIGGDTVACAYHDFPDSFGVFLPLAGISTVKQIKESAFDIKATGRLNRLYMELLKDNPEWGKADRRPDMNHFMARLIFCFFAEDTDIFASSRLFTGTIEQMSNRDGTNTHEIIREIFRAMNVPLADRADANLPRWADAFPYVNGGLFSGSTEVPRFSKIAQRYLSHIGGLDWTKINPDIFGSMIQAVADEGERSALGMHYTSVPNILKVLNPLFLDDLNTALEEAGDNGRKLLNLRNRIAKIRVFDPACGSGNFLVIAYKKLREIEAEINRRRGEADRKTDIPLTNFRGIELRDFSAEIARLALIIAEYQCDVIYRGQKEALAEFLPLDSQNWIISANALLFDWLSICPPTGKNVKISATDLFHIPNENKQIDFENEGGETYICGNPPYLGTKYQTRQNKEEISNLFASENIKSGNIDYVGCWLLLAARFFAENQNGSFAFVSTTSLFQGEQAEIVLNILNKYNLGIAWCHTSFTWSNNASNNAGVICCIVGCAKRDNISRPSIYSGSERREVDNIGPYLVPMPNLVVTKRGTPISDVSQMKYGSMANDDGIFDVTPEDYDILTSPNIDLSKAIKRTVGGAEFIRGIVRKSIYLDEKTILTEKQKDALKDRFNKVRNYRLGSTRAATRKLASTPEYYAEMRHEKLRKIFVPQVLSERRIYVTAGFLDKDDLVIAPHMQIVNGHLYEFALISSKLHHVWISTVCGRLKSDIRYSNLLGWNTFPIPKLTETNRSDLARSAEMILLARESHFPASIAELYDAEKMPEDLKYAHQLNDEILERAFIGRLFKNDTERLQVMLGMYERMVTALEKKNEI